MSMKVVSTRIENELFDKLQEVSKKEERSISWLVKKGIELVLRDAQNGKIDGKLAKKKK